MTAERGSKDPGKEILTLEEAAAFLGVSGKTFLKVLREGEIPARKIGREWKFSRTALIEWVGQGRARDFLKAAPARARPTRGAAARAQAPGAGDDWDVGLD